MVAFALFFGIGIFVMGQNLPKFLIGFVGLFVVVVIAMILGKQSTMAYYGIGVEPWGIMFGMIIANTIGTPQWMKPALQVEYFIKTGLVLLGAEILFDKIIAIGTAGIFVAWVVTPIVLITTFIFGQKVLKMASPTLNITISADMSVCGTSAAIAAAAACRAKKEELTLALGLSMTFTAIMMVALPAFIKYLGLPEVLGGADRRYGRLHGRRGRRRRAARPQGHVRGRDHQDDPERAHRRDRLRYRRVLVHQR